MQLKLRHLLQRMSRKWRLAILLSSFLVFLSCTLLYKLTVFGNTWLGVLATGLLEGLIVGYVVSPTIDSLIEDDRT